MRLVAFIVCFLILSFDSLGQWQYINSGTTQTLYDLTVLNPDTLFVVGDSGLVMKSFDGGTTWINVSLNSTDRLVAVDFRDHIHGIITTNEGLILKTDDGGSTWDSLYTSQANSVAKSIKLTNDSCIFVAGYFISGNILVSYDSGQTWTIDSLFNFGLDVVTSIDTFNDSICVAVTQFASVFLSYNKGITWTLIRTGGGNDGANAVQILNDSTYLATGCEPNCDWCFIRTVDSGISWYGPGTPKGQDLFFFNDGTGHIIRGCGGAGSIISYSQDFGITYIDTYNSLSYDTMLTSIQFADYLTGYSVGTNGVILKTTNGGVTSINENELKIVSFYPNPIHSSATIDVNAIFETADLKIYNQIGELILQQLLSEKQTVLNFEGSTNGIYYYQIYINSTLSITGKFLVQVTGR